jgi:glucose/mannose-6-phosphate isomerase
VSTAALGKDAIEAVDKGGMLGDVLAQPLQLGDALWRTQSADIRARDLPGGFVVCGMGGSAIGGDLAKAALGDRATRPITVVRGYALESWTPPESFVLCASYSGNTEETLACFEAAGAAGAQRVVLTTGGTLGELARAEGVPVIGVPAGMQPRAAVIYTTIGAMECAALCGAAPALHSEIDMGTALLERLVEEWGPAAPEDALPKRIARELQGRLPVVLEDPDQHPRVGRHIELMCAQVERAGAPTTVVPARGESRLERVLAHVLLGDLVSVYLAALEGIDPTPVEAIDRLKASLDD